MSAEKIQLQRRNGAVRGKPVEDGIPYSIDIVELSKSFQRRTAARADYTTIKSALLNRFRNKTTSQRKMTHAVENLTMRVPTGTSMGIIGRNGSGKSTLLKLITGIYRPDTGVVRVNGRVAALIELGAGFHPDFTGRENLELGGVLHGLSREEIRERFDQIVRFAELEDVIDDPVRTYSSGMFMRLGFSLAVHTDPDVLLIDEVLAVGDAAFVSKCKERISQLRREGKTLLLVSHDLGAVERWCDEAIWLESGRVQDRGDPRRVIDAYREFVESGEELELQQAARESASEAGGDGSDDGTRAAENGAARHSFGEPARWGSREVEITSVTLVDKEGRERMLLHPVDPASIVIGYRVHEPVSDVVFGIGIHRSDGLPVHGTNTDIEELLVPQLAETGQVAYRIDRLGLLDGQYVLDVAAHRSDGYAYDYHKAAIRFAVRWPLPQIGVVLPEHRWEIAVGGGAFRPLELAEREMMRSGTTDD